MSFFSKLFGHKPAPAPARPDFLAAPPRLVQEGPEFPVRPIVVERQVPPAAVEAALAATGFSRDEDGKWRRAGTAIESGEATGGLRVLTFGGEAVLEAQRDVLARFAWVNPDQLYARLQPATPAEDLPYLIWAARHYRCAGGVPAALRSHPDVQVKEAVRLVDRDVMAEQARARRR